MAIQNELMISGFNTKIEQKIRHPEAKVHSAFLKTNTLETFIQIGLTEREKKITNNHLTPAFKAIKLTK